MQHIALPTTWALLPVLSAFLDAGRPGAWTYSAHLPGVWAGTPDKGQSDLRENVR